MKKLNQIFRFCLLLLLVANFSLVKAQIYQQQFGTDSATFNLRAMANGLYVNNTSPNNSQLTFLNAASNASATIGISGGRMNLTRPGTGTLLAVRNANFTARVLMMRFDYNLQTASGTSSNATVLYCGNGYANTNSTPSNNHSTFNLGISTTGTPGSYRINSTGGSYNSTRTITWVVNNSGAAVTYRAPNGTNESLPDDSYDIWVGTTKEQDNIAAASGTQNITNFAIRNAGGNATHNYDNILVDTLPAIPTAQAASNIVVGGFTANWSTITGVTGYRIDVATDAAFTNMVSGYDNLYVSGGSTNSLVISGLSSGTYFYRVRAANAFTVGEFASGNSASQSATTGCATPTVNNQPSTSTQTLCLNEVATTLTFNTTGATTNQWYSNTTNSNVGGTLISGANSYTFTPPTTNSGTTYYYCIASAGVGCTVTSDASGAIVVNTRPTPSFVAAPSGTVASNTDLTYTTEASNSNYVWTFSGINGVDYSITSGGTSLDNSVVLKWLTTGSKTVTVNYNNANNCSGANTASNTVNVSASVFYNTPNSDITIASNWNTDPSGSGGSVAADFTSDGQTFNITNTGASMSSSWVVSGTGSKVVVGTGLSSYIFTASNDITATVDVNNNATIILQTSNIPTWGNLESGSTVEYGGSSITQAITPTTYSNLTLSGSGTRNFSGTTNISGTFIPGTGFSATSGTIVLNGNSTSQSIPAFSYNNLTISGVNGKQTSGNISVAGVLTMSNSFTVISTSTLLLGSSASMSSTAGTSLTVNGTFEIQQNSVTFSAGNGNITVAAGGIFKMSGTVPNNALAFTNVNFTNGIGASGSTLYIATNGCPRLPTAANGTFNGNVTYDLFSGGVPGTVNILNATPITIGGNLNVLNTYGSILTQASGGTARTLNVSGSFNMTGISRYDISANGSTGSCILNVTGNVNISSSTDTLYLNNASSTGGTGTLNISSNLNHSAGIIGRGALSNASGLVSFNGSTSQDISTIGIASNVNITLNNTNGARLLTDLAIGSTLTLSNGRLRTNGYSIIMSGTTSSIASASSNAYVATCDAAGVASTTGGLVIQNIGTGGRTTTQTFPIGTNTSYNPCTINNNSSAVSFTARINSNPFAGTTSDSTVARTWNIQPASGTPNAVIGLQWNASEEGANFNRASASIAQWNGSTITNFSNGGTANGSNPYTLTSGTSIFTTYGDFGLIPGIIIPASEPTVQATNATVTNITSNSVTLNWTAGDGTNSIVVVRANNAVNASPVDGVAYSDGTSVFGSGSNLGNNNFVVYNGSANTVTISGLGITTQYHFAVYAFNGSNGSENYLTTNPALANGTTIIPSYYYVGGVGSTSNTFATANMWATSLGGAPLTSITPTANDIFIFDGSNIGGGVSDSVTLSWINSTTTIGKLILQNNARVRIDAGGTRTVSLGNSGFAANTTALDIPSGSKLYFSGSGTTISLAANSAATISGNLQMGNTSNNITLVPNAIGSSITVNSGAYVEINGSSNSALPFGTSSTPLTTFKNGSIVKSIRGGDIFGGAANNAVAFEPSSLFIFANSGSSTVQTTSGRTFGNVQIEANWSPAGHGGFTMFNVSMPLTGVTFTINDTTTTNFKGDISIAAGNTFRFNPSAASVGIATCNFNGSGLQTITNNGTWTVGSTVRQNFIVNNGVGLNIAGSVGIASSGLTGSSFTLNSGNTLGLIGGSLLVPNSGTLNINGNITRTSGNINATSSTSTVNLTGVSVVPANTFRGDTAANLILNRASGITFNGNINIITALSLVDGVINMGNNSMNIFAGKTVTRSNTSWINGTLRKNYSTGAQTRTFEIGDANNYLPVTIRIANVTTAGDLAIRTQTPATSFSNYSTAPISNDNYINRYWTLTGLNNLAFTNYGASLTWLGADVVGTSTANSVKAVRFNGSSWTKSDPIALSSTSDSVLAQTGFGTIILADDCIQVTPSISISTSSETVCSGNSVTFNAIGVNTGTSPTYTWKRNNIDVGSGSSIVFPPNSLTTGDVITCVLTANNNCQTSATANSNSITLAVNNSPLAATVSSQFGSNTTAFTMCNIGSSISLYPSIQGGVWSSNNGFVTTTQGNLNNSAVYANANANGTTTLTYTLTSPTNGCSTSTTINAKVAQQASPNSIVGNTAVCPGTVNNYTTTSTGGVWSSSGFLSINPNTGVATATSAGNTRVIYTLTNADGCRASASLAVTVNPLPAVPNFTYASGTINPQTSGGFCTNRTFTLIGFPSGGSWSSSGVISVTSGGVVSTGAVTGAGSVTYRVTNPTTQCSNSRTFTSNVVACAFRGNSNLISKSNNYVIYPNPAKNVVNINIENIIGKAQIFINDNLGRVVKQQNLSIGLNTIDISNLAKGTYIVNILSEQNRNVEKLIIE